MPSSLSSSFSPVVLYPGSGRHITASLIFSNVVYVDMDRKLREFFQDERVTEWVEQHKEYSNEKPFIQFLGETFDTPSSLLPLESVDLLISASAGIVSVPCAKYLKVSGYLLVSDAHFDARQAYISSQFELKAVIRTEDGTVGDALEDWGAHFVTTNGNLISVEHVEESKLKPKSRRSFKLRKEGMFYLFQKTSSN